MATDRFKRIQYNLCRFFRSRGVLVDTKKKSIRVDPELLTPKELAKLNELKRWGYTVTDTNKKYVNEPQPYEVEETFCDFADEVIAMCNNGIQY
ncbi:hypothetical protein [Dysgonomonas sp. ZJ279]|uniref:hypothetical protein n=1 Tax=Dysgonomonas sp. ZJ279 TaxID=2709796 RepID=UPI0013ECD995|nr:hypothetical protein [Dysgonomonas sp. ZJ279]